jgi:hypothetical protein
MSEKTIPFDITREEILNLAAQKLVDAYGGDPDIAEQAEDMVRRKVDNLFADENIRKRIDEALTAEMDKLLGQEIHPVNIWGEREGGKPTTIRAQLAERARKFWEVPVNEDGRESPYGGTPRSEALLKKIVKEKFEDAIKANADVIVSEFKKALLADSTKLVTEHIDRLIPNRSR